MRRDCGHSATLSKYNPLLPLSFQPGRQPFIYPLPVHGTDRLAAGRRDDRAMGAGGNGFGRPWAGAGWLYWSQAKTYCRPIGGRSSRDRAHSIGHWPRPPHTDRRLAIRRRRGCGLNPGSRYFSNSRCPRRIDRLVRCRFDCVEKKSGSTKLQRLASVVGVGSQHDHFKQFSLDASPQSGKCKSIAACGRKFTDRHFPVSHSFNFAGNIDDWPVLIFIQGQFVHFSAAIDHRKHWQYRRVVPPM